MGVYRKIKKYKKSFGHFKHYIRYISEKERKGVNKMFGDPNLLLIEYLYRLENQRKNDQEKLYYISDNRLIRY